MRTFLNGTIGKEVEIRGLVQSGDKSSYATRETATGYLRPLSELQSTQNNINYGRGHMLMVEASVDIREHDEAIIDGVKYTVRGVATFDVGSIPFKRAIISLPEKR